MMCCHHTIIVTRAVQLFDRSSVCHLTTNAVPLSLMSIPEAIHVVSHKISVNHVERSHVCHLSNNVVPLSLLSISYDTCVSTCDVNISLVNDSSFVKRKYISHSHSKPFIPDYDDVIDVPSLSSSFHIIKSDDNGEDVCTQLDNDVSLNLLDDTCITCDVTAPSYRYNDDALSPQQYSHGCNAINCHDTSAMSDPIPHDYNTSKMVDMNYIVLQMRRSSSLIPTVFGPIYRHSFHYHITMM